MWEKKPKELCTDGQVVKVSWGLPKGLVSQLVPGSFGEMVEGFKENKVFKSCFVNHGAQIGLL